MQSTVYGVTSMVSKLLDSTRFETEVCNEYKLDKVDDMFR